MFDPTLPQENTPVDAVQMRAQLNGLKDLIDAAPTITSAVVDSVSDVNPGMPAVVNVSVSNSVLHFAFEIPRGFNGTDGSNGSDGAPGEVSNTQLDTAIAGTAANCNSVSLPSFTVSDPPTQFEMQQVADKLLELMNALRR